MLKASRLAIVAEQIRELLLPLDYQDRREVLIATAICPECGEDHNAMYESRGFWMCTCTRDD